MEMETVDMEMETVEMEMETVEMEMETEMSTNTSARTAGLPFGCSRENTCSQRENTHEDMGTYSRIFISIYHC